MYSIYYPIILLLLIIYFLFKHQKKNIIETLTNNIEALTNNLDIVLIGDSMLENSNYVEQTHTVGSNIKKTHKKTLILAKDESIINDIKSQLNNIPEKLNNKNTFIFLSVGGNDLLEIYKYQNTNINDLSHINQVFSKYKNLVHFIKKKYNFNLILLNIYFPKDEMYIKFHEIIKIWNKKLLKFSKKNNFKFLDISKILYKKKHFTNGIEPSIKGSKLLANSIINF
jgi:lysophospholipase L1-like esterase|tara:strand:+ start:41 stop:718 length:678 start_codon:yes stop_codon:yes gene_type:complete